MYYEMVEEVGENGRIIRSAEQENYFSVYGEPEDERQEIIGMIERDGLWHYEGQVRCKCCGQWTTVDSIGMVIGDLADSGYREDLIDAIKEHTE